MKVEVNPAFVRKDEIKRLTGNTQKLFTMISKPKQNNLNHILKSMYER